MSVLADLIYGGADAMAGLAENGLREAISKYGPDQSLAFPETEYFFPGIYALTGRKVTCLGDLTHSMEALKALLSAQKAKGQTLDMGLATLLAMEVQEGLKYIEPHPYESTPYQGFLPDATARDLEAKLHSGSFSGVGLILGDVPSVDALKQVINAYQEKGTLLFLVGYCVSQCCSGEIPLGISQGLIPLGQDSSALVHMFTLFFRWALDSGAVQPGAGTELSAWCQAHIPGFFNTFGAIDAVVISAGAGSASLGFPLVVDIPLGENQLPGRLESGESIQTILEKSLALALRPETSANNPG